MTALFNPVPRRRGRPSTHRNRRECIPCVPIECRSFIDSIRLTLPSKIPSTLFKALVDTAGLDRRLATKPIVKYFRLPTGKKATLLTLHQPSFTTFDVLDVIADGDLLLPAFEISRVDVSLDLLVDSRGSADALKSYLISRLVPKGIRPSKPWRVRGSANSTSAYLQADGPRGHVVTIYSDKATKTLERCPCTHLEWRFKGAAAVARAGLNSSGELRLLDHRQFWHDRLRLLRPRHVSVSAHDHLLTLLGSNSQKELLRKNFDCLPHEWMLPCSESALWDTVWWQAYGSGKVLESAIPTRSTRLPLLEAAAEFLY